MTVFQDRFRMPPFNDLLLFENTPLLLPFFFFLLVLEESSSPKAPLLLFFLLSLDDTYRYLLEDASALLPGI